MQTPAVELAAKDPLIAGILNKYVISTTEKMFLLIFPCKSELRPYYFSGLRLSMGNMLFTYPLWQMLSVIQQLSF